MSVFAILPAHGAVSHDRSARAGGAPLRAGGASTTEAAHTGGLRRAVWLAVSRGRTAPGRAPLPAADGRLCSPGRVTRAAEAANPARSPDDILAHRHAAARALCDGRPALGRSLHARAAQPPGRSRSDSPYPGAVDLSTRLQLALDGALAPHAGDAAALAATPCR